MPQLRHLWVNERVLAIPPSDIRDDVWNVRPFEGEPQEKILSRTVNSSHWELLGRAFEKLESLRVGFGPLNARWVAKVLSRCDRMKLGAFGFDWEWQPGSTEPVRPHFLSMCPSKKLSDDLGRVLRVDYNSF